MWPILDQKDLVDTSICSLVSSSDGGAAQLDIGFGGVGLHFLVGIRIGITRSIDDCICHGMLKTKTEKRKQRRKRERRTERESEEKKMYEIVRKITQKKRIENIPIIQKKKIAKKKMTF